MKTCMICGTQAKDSEATCPNDGEASWSSEAKAFPKISAVIVEDVEAPARESKAPRGGSKR